MSLIAIEDLLTKFRDPSIRNGHGIVSNSSGIRTVQAMRLVSEGYAEWIVEPTQSNGRSWQWQLKDATSKRKVAKR